MKFTAPHVFSAAIAAIALTLALPAACVLAADPHTHNHDAKGPHGGVLVELGEDRLHAEVTHDDRAGTVMVYLVDVDARQYVAVESTELVINVRHDRQPEQFRLRPVSQRGDRQGLASSFGIKSPRLVALLDDHHSTARLTIKINGRSFAGDIPHIHDHEHDDLHTH